MDYNLFSTPKINPIWNESNHPLCKRAKLDTGTFCNLNCEFCYYKDQLDKMDSFETICKRVDYLATYSLITEIELSGGESSIHPRWFDILAYCNTKFNYISTLSHGQKFSNAKFLLASREAGLKEILFSMHGTYSIHDNIVQKQGAYLKLKRAIRLANKLGIKTRINCTVTNSNYNNIKENFVDEMLKLWNPHPKPPHQPQQLNFIFLNYWTDNETSETLDYSRAAPAVMVAIRKLKAKLPDLDIRIRYLPFCYAEEFTDLVYGQFQHVFDTTDWNKEVYSGKQYFDPAIKYTWKQSVKFGYDAAYKDRLASYRKPKECFKCKFFYDCDGIEKQFQSKDFKVYPQI